MTSPVTIDKIKDNNSDKKILKRVLVFDLDDCLYPKSAGVFKIVHKNIQQFLVNFMEDRRKNNLPLPEEIDNSDGTKTPQQIKLGYEQFRQRMFITYGTSMNGLIKTGYISPDILKDDKFFMDFSLMINDFNFEDVKLTQNDQKLIELFEKLRKNHHLSEDDKNQQGLIVLFSNSDKVHSHRILDYLGISNYFDLFVNFDDFKMDGKPQETAYRMVERKCKEYVEKSKNNSWTVDPKLTEFVFFDDNIINVKKSVDLGWNGVFVCDDLIADNKAPVFEKKHEKELAGELELNGGKIKIIRSVLDIPRRMQELI